MPIQVGDTLSLRTIGNVHRRPSDGSLKGARDLWYKYKRWWLPPKFHEIASTPVENSEGIYWLQKSDIFLQSKDSHAGVTRNMTKTSNTDIEVRYKGKESQCYYSGQRRRWFCEKRVEIRIYPIQVSKEKTRIIYCNNKNVYDHKRKILNKCIVLPFCGILSNKLTHLIKNLNIPVMFKSKPSFYVFIKGHKDLLLIIFIKPIVQILKSVTLSIENKN